MRNTLFINIAHDMVKSCNIASIYSGMKLSKTGPERRGLSQFPMSMWPLLRALIQFAPFLELHFGFGFLRLAETSASELLPIGAPGMGPRSSISSALWIPEVSSADSPSA